MASSVKVATVKTTPKSPSTAKVMACASLATKTAELDASLSRLHSTPTEGTAYNLLSYHSNIMMSHATTELKQPLGAK